jgi:hypothetical protein
LLIALLSHAVSAINGLYVALGSPKLPGWSASGGDPCGESWQGVTCTGSSITSMYASYSMSSFASKTFLFCAFINSLFAEFSMLQIWEDS